MHDASFTVIIFFNYAHVLFLVQCLQAAIVTARLQVEEKIWPLIALCFAFYNSRARGAFVLVCLKKNHPFQMISIWLIRSNE